MFNTTTINSKNLKELTNLIVQYVLNNPSIYSYKVWIPSYESAIDPIFISIILNNIKDDYRLDFKVTIFTTDKEKFSINKIKKLSFNKKELNFLSSKDLEKYFNITNNNFTFKEKYENGILFSTLDLEKEAPLSNVDIIFTNSSFSDYDQSFKPLIGSILTYSLKVESILVLDKIIFEHIDLENFSIKSDNIYIKKTYKEMNRIESNEIKDKRNISISNRNIEKTLKEKDFKIKNLEYELKILKNSKNILERKYNQSVMKIHFIEKAFDTIFYNLKTEMLLIDYKFKILKHMNKISDFFILNKMSVSLSAENINSKYFDDDLMLQIKTVIKNNTNKEFEINLNDLSYLVNIIALNKPNNYLNIDSGVLITITDRSDNARKDKLLFQQSKLASMGEMINNIAHQWRQPLNIINLNVIKLQFLDEEQNINLLERNEVYEEMNQLVEFMSNTIDDFSSFFEPNTQKSAFYIEDLFKEIKNLFINKLYLGEINFEYDEKLLINTHKNVLKHILLVFLNNSTDSFNEKNINSGKIKISVKKTSDFIDITYIDNAGGIKNELLEKIFEPYFTTKSKSQGTGIGLYMVKMFIEKILKGNLKLENYEDGIKINIDFKL